jgi:predicted Fe-S protein YdhL (DUF1289 family)
VNPAPTKVTKHALQEHGAFHDFYGVAGDADGVDADGADEEFAGAAGFDALADQGLLMGRPILKMEKRNWLDGEKSKSPPSEKRGWGTRREEAKQQIPRAARNGGFCSGAARVSAARFVWDTTEAKEAEIFLHCAARRTRGRAREKKASGRFGRDDRIFVWRFSARMKSCPPGGGGGSEAGAVVLDSARGNGTISVR